jgi:hypothetical protein
MDIKGHFTTITEHRIEVMKNCFRAGIYVQGLTHDLSKYSPAEFWRGAKYYQGNCSPNNAERKATGVSKAWLHHKGRNKHHMEYWIDYDLRDGGKMAGLEMPVNYVVEMACDRIAASKIYMKDAYTDRAPLEYYLHSSDHYLIDERTARQLSYILTMLAEKGEDETFKYMRKKLIYRYKREKRQEHIKEYMKLCSIIKKEAQYTCKKAKHYLSQD